MAAQHGRYFRPKPKELLGTPFDSLTEYKLAQQLPSIGTRDVEPIPYTVEHKYTPDFKFTAQGVDYYIEVKGYFQDATELQKYNWINETLQAWTDAGRVSRLIFVFENPGKAIHFRAKRKDGSKMTHAEWAEKNGFEWFSPESFTEWMKQWET